MASLIIGLGVIIVVLLIVNVWSFWTFKNHDIEQRRYELGHIGYRLTMLVVEEEASRDVCLPLYELIELCDGNLKVLANSRWKLSALARVARKTEMQKHIRTFLDSPFTHLPSDVHQLAGEFFWAMLLTLYRSSTLLIVYAWMFTRSNINQWKLLPWWLHGVGHIEQLCHEGLMQFDHPSIK